SHVIHKDGELFLIGAFIGPYKNCPTERQHDPERSRKLLMKKHEIKSLIGNISRKGYSLVPTQVYFNNRGWAKVQIGLGKGLKKPDKREKIKKRDQKRRMQRKYKDAQIR
ncbi:MAG: SsrA-binding protein, partial [bacterium]